MYNLGNLSEDIMFFSKNLLLVKKKIQEKYRNYGMNHILKNVFKKKQFPILFYQYRSGKVCLKKGWIEEKIDLNFGKISLFPLFPISSLPLAVSYFPAEFSFIYNLLEMSRKKNFVQKFLELFFPLFRQPF